ncbi:facilitated trehalose transporter Tret1 [Diabrotica virgifera virgifera]|uniref:Major facilitator superfamily (MFS) profile domain-containing protein n=2 Tax=Diabrotica virgifera virgifera TaxID=50390 RepID=A0ABM5ISW4_DIAVI|nr:facilitated trehalose transporter Tret1 [Diabrotica virgifera virgifera]
MGASGPNRTYLYLVAIAANISVFVCGTAFGWSSPVIPRLKNLDASPLDHVISTSEEGLIASFLPLAAVLGPVLGGILASKIGKKLTLIIAVTPFIIAFIIFTIATKIELFYFGRFLCGLACGMTYVNIPTYIAEIADNEVRGSLGSYLQLFCTIGILFPYSLGPYVTLKLFNIILLFPPTICIVLFIVFLPESPYYLLQRGKIEQALQVLSKLSGKPTSIAEKDLADMQVQIRQESEQKGGFGLIMKTPGLRRALILSLCLVIFQQFTGINVVFFFTQTLFEDAGVALAPEICTIIVGIIQILASTLSPLFVEKSGKRRLLMISGIGSAVSVAVLAIYFYIKDVLKSDTSSISWLPIASLLAFIIAYSMGFGPIPWAYIGELFPGNVQSLASTIVISLYWFCCFLTVNYFGFLTSLLGAYGAFGFFSCCSVMATLFVLKFMPETTGLSLQEIQILLTSGKITYKERVNL